MQVQVQAGGHTRLTLVQSHIRVQRSVVYSTVLAVPLTVCIVCIKHSKLSSHLHLLQPHAMVVVPILLLMLLPSSPQMPAPCCQARAELHQQCQLPARRPAAASQCAAWAGRAMHKLMLDF